MVSRIGPGHLEPIVRSWTHEPSHGARRAARRGWRRPGESAHALADALRGAGGQRPHGGAHARPERARALGRLGISRGSVSRAYDRLREEGYLVRARGAGSWLTLPDGAAGRAAAARAARRVLNLTSAALPAPDPLLADAATRAAAALPRLCRPATRRPACPSCARRSPPGSPRAAWRPRADEVLVTAGAQHALHLLLTLLAGPGERVLVDAPAYPRTLAAIRTARARAVAVPLDADRLGRRRLGGDARRRRAGAGGHRRRLPQPDRPRDERAPTGRRWRARARARARCWSSTRPAPSCASTARPLPPPLGALDPGGVRRHGRHDEQVGVGRPAVGWIRASRRLVAELAASAPTSTWPARCSTSCSRSSCSRDWDAVLADRRALLRDRRAALLDALPSAPAGRCAARTAAWARGCGCRRRSRPGSPPPPPRDGIAVTPGPAFSVDGTFERHIRLPFTLPPDDAARRDWSAWRGATRRRARPRGRPRARGRAPGPAIPTALGAAPVHWQADGEARAAARGVVGVDLAVVRGDDPGDDRQAQARARLALLAAAPRRARSARTARRSRRSAGPGRGRGPRAPAGRRRRATSTSIGVPGGRVDKRVAQQVGQHLAQLVGIAAHVAWPDGAGRCRGRARSRGRRRPRRRPAGEVDVLADQVADLVQARERQQVLDEHAHARGLGLDARHRLLGVLGVARRADPEQLGVAADRRQRRAQLVRRVGQEGAQPVLGRLLLGERLLEPVQHPVQRQARAGRPRCAGSAGSTRRDRSPAAIEPAVTPMRSSGRRPMPDQPPRQRAQRQQDAGDDQRLDAQQAVQRRVGLGQRDRRDRAGAVASLGPTRRRGRACPCWWP